MTTQKAPPPPSWTWSERRKWGNILLFSASTGKHALHFSRFNVLTLTLTLNLSHLLTFWLLFKPLLTVSLDCWSFYWQNLVSESFLLWFFCISLWIFHCACLASRFTSAVVYQGLIMRLGILGGNVYIDFLISGLVEFPAAFLILFTIERVGRRLPFATANIVAGVSCLITAFIPESGLLCVCVITDKPSRCRQFMSWPAGSSRRHVLV